MSHPASEPVRDERVNQASLPPGALFSHPPAAHTRERRCTGGYEDVDWRATPFFAGHHDSTVDGQPIPADRHASP